MDAAVATVVLYSTMPDAAAAETAGRRLVDERLAACANIIPGMRAVYRWEGAIETASEAVLLVKTTAAAAEAAAARLRAIHPYRTPCVLRLTAAGGDPAWLAWLAGAVSPP